MTPFPTKKIIERLLTGVLALSFLVGCLSAYQTYFGKTSLLLPAQATLPVSTEPVFVAGVEPEIQWLAMAEKNDDVMETTYKATGLGVPEFEVRRRMGVLAYKAHENKSPTPGGLGSYGCAVAIWHHVIRPALVAAYPEKGKLIPVQLQHTQQIINFYKSGRQVR